MKTTSRQKHRVMKGSAAADVSRRQSGIIGNARTAGCGCKLFGILTALSLGLPIQSVCAASISLETVPPVVVKTVPVAGATDVDPGLTELRVTYSKAMQDGGWSWTTWGEENFPEMTGDPRYLADGRTCVLPVKLEPNKFYATWLNSDKFKNFRDAGGRPAVPYLMTFTTASTAARTLTPIPKAEDLPGKLMFRGRYHHRSRGRDIDTPSEFWLKEIEEGVLTALAHLPWMGTRELASGDPENRLTSYRIEREASGSRPGYHIDLELSDGKALLTRRGVRQDCDDRELRVPVGAQFDPNTRPDPYCAANILLRAFAVGEGETKEFHVYDWDNAGEGLVEYTIQIQHAGKERVEVPAGVFEANHLVLKQLTSGDTWFKKRAGHITDFWVLDNHVIVRVLRHREPYEMLLLDYTVPDDLGALSQARADPAPAEPPADAPSVVTVGQDGGAQFTSIQAAIDAVGNQGTVQIGAGRYAERLEITRPVRLMGAGWQETVVGPTNAWPRPTEEQMREMDAKFRAATSDTERSRLREEFSRQLQPPVLCIKGAEGAFLEGLKFTQSGASPDGKLLPGAVIEVRSAELGMKDCAIVGSPGSGIVLTDGTRSDIRNTLIAAVWNRGVAVANKSVVFLSDCDIRNCHYAGVTLKRDSEAVIERCRISGAAWHGIRYDHVSPRIEGNLIFGNARSGIYASGNTQAHVRNNVFFNNEMNGISCWSNNRDVIKENTFANNLREALSILGASTPTVRGNVFSSHPVALYQGHIGGDNTTKSLGQPLVLENLFWDNATNWVRWTRSGVDDKAQPEVVELGEATRSRMEDPKFQNPDEKDFALQPDAPARRERIGAADLITFASPWPLQPEEKAIIPDGDTRDSRQWKRPGG